MLIAGRTLHLTVKKKWFDMIESGEKKEEYRELKRYWGNRLTKLIAFEYREGLEHFLLRKEMFYRKYDTVTFRNGYSKDARRLIIECKGIDIDLARPEWSDNWQGKVFVIKLGEILK